MGPSLSHLPRIAATLCSGGALLLATACVDQAAGPPATATPIQFNQQPQAGRAPLASPEVITRGGEASVPGLHIEDNCITGQIDPLPARGQIFGNGVNLVVDADTTENFSRAVADTSSIVCRPNVQRSDVDQLVARLNGIQGIRVVDSTLVGR